MFYVKMERTSYSKLGRIKKKTLRNAREAKLARAAAYNSGRRMRRLFEKTTATWNHKVEFKLRVSAKIGDNVVIYGITTTDEIWHWIDQGTEFRNVMSDPDHPYKAKTWPGAFDSTAGAGRMIGSNTPRPGIEARGWSHSKKAKITAELLLRAEVGKQFRKLETELKGG